MKLKFLLYLILAQSFVFTAIAQRTDTLVVGGLSLDSTQKKRADSIAKVENFIPKKAIVRSAIIPGWGQAYNKKYWKIPIIYGGLGTATYFFITNLNQYKDARAAYANAMDGDPSNDHLIPEPYYSVRMQPQRIANFRNSVRQNMDYSALAFLVIWGLNVADAAVDAHLRSFDVSDDLSFQIKPGFSDFAGTAGISFVLNIR